MKIPVIILNSPLLKVTPSNRVNFQTNMTSFKLTFKYVLLTLVAVFLSFFVHECCHWITGEALGYKMTMTLNSVSLAEGSYSKNWHETLVSAAGPIFEILQAIIFYRIMKRRNNINLYPFLFTPLYMRVLAGAMNYFNLNDEGRISHSLHIGDYTLSIIVCLVLLIFVVKISRQYKYTAKFQLINFLLVMLFSSILIMSDQFLRVRIIN